MLHSSGTILENEIAHHNCSYLCRVAHCSALDNHQSAGARYYLMETDVCGRISTLMGVNLKSSKVENHLKDMLTCSQLGSFRYKIS